MLSGGTDDCTTPVNIVPGGVGDTQHEGSPAELLVIPVGSWPARGLWEPPPMTRILAHPVRKGPLLWQVGSETLNT